MESIFRSRGGTEEDHEIAKEKPYSAWLGILCLVSAPYVLIFGVYSERLFYTIHIETLWARVIAFIVLLIFGLQSFKGWRKNEN